MKKAVTFGAAFFTIVKVDKAPMAFCFVYVIQILF